MNQLPIDDKNWAYEVKALWLSSGIKIEPGAQFENVKLTQSIIGFNFPLEMIALYQIVNGFKDWDWTKGMISIWPIERIREEYETNRVKNFVGFCDFLINSHCIGFFKDRNGIYKSYDEFNPVANSFRQAIDLINNDADVIY